MAGQTSRCEVRHTEFIATRQLLFNCTLKKACLDLQVSGMSKDNELEGGYCADNLKQPATCILGKDPLRGSSS